MKAQINQNSCISIFLSCKKLPFKVPCIILDNAGQVWTTSNNFKTVECAPKLVFFTETKN